jgi:hypothetical protein
MMLEFLKGAAGHPETGPLFVRAIDRWLRVRPEHPMLLPRAGDACNGFPTV